MRKAFSTAPIVFGLCLLFVACLPRTAAAADPEAGLAIDRLDRPGVGSRFYASDTLALREPWRPAFGVMSGYTYRAFSIVQADGGRSSLVRNLWTADLAGDIVIAGGLRLGMSLPVALFEDGHDTLIGTSAVVAHQGAAAGDLKIAGDVYAYGEQNAPLQVAVGVAAYLPTGDRSAFMGDGTARVHPRVLLTGRTRALVWGARAGYMLRPHEEFLGGVELGSEAVVGGSFGLQHGGLTVGPELLGSTVISGQSGPFTKETTAVEALLSAHHEVGRTFIVGAGLGTRITEGLGAPTFRAVLSFEYLPVQRLKGPDRDGDGVPDEIDRCPAVPGCDPHEPGCPMPPIDTDGDGLPDYQPTCSLQAAPPATAPAPAPAEPTSRPVTPTPPSTLDPCERVDSTDCGRMKPSPPPEKSPLPIPDSLRTWGL
jgi:OOP family OmpA-OmpF porin